MARIVNRIISLLRKRFSKSQRGRRAGDRLFSKTIRNATYATLILVGILLTGTVGYIFLEGWSLLDSLWMTVITMSTVGFSEVTPLDPAGRILTILLIVSTLFIGGFAVGNIGAFVFGGEVVNILRCRKLERDIDRLSGHVILTGYGRVGREAAKEWNMDELVIIDNSSDNLSEADQAGFMTIKGDATNDSILRKAGIERAHAIMIATGHVADNVLISLTARELNPAIIISARGSEQSSEVILKRAGANKVVLPHQIGGKRLAAYLKHPSVVHFLDLVMRSDDLSLSLQEFEVSADSCLVGQSLKKSDIRKSSGGALVMAIKCSDGKTVVAPPPDQTIEAGNILITLGTDIALENVRKLTV